VASRALSAHFRSVTLLDRDEEPAQAVPRSGVPQGRHIHVVLPGGVRALDRLFPGRLPELVRAGSQPFDYGQSQFHMYGQNCLQCHGHADEAFRRDYFRRADAVIEVPWAPPSGENFKYPQTTGRRPLSFPLTRLYKDRLATCGDAAVIHDFYRVVSLSAPPRIWLRPRVVARTLGLWR
jgi:2-polyprenyl-6-methoxyphenol hydroxylase-like FAD-dependent oxidoreductase